MKESNLRGYPRPHASNVAPYHSVNLPKSLRLLPSGPDRFHDNLRITQKERMGFEPTEPFRVLRFSKPTP